MRSRIGRFCRDSANSVGRDLLHRHRPAFRRFVGVGRPNHGQPRNRAQARDLFNGLVRRAVFAQSDRVMREHVDRVQLHQRAQADGGLHVIGERQERRRIRDHPAVRRETVHRGAHRMLANAEVQVAAGETPHAARLSPGDFPPYAPAGSKSPMSFNAVLVDGFRSAEPPIRLGIRFASALSACPAATRVAIGLSVVFHFGRSAFQSSGSLPRNHRVPVSWRLPGMPSR